MQTQSSNSVPSIVACARHKTSRPAIMKSAPHTKKERNYQTAVLTCTAVAPAIVSAVHTAHAAQRGRGHELALRPGQNVHLR